MVPRFADGGYVGEAGSKGLIGGKTGGTHNIRMGVIKIEMAGSSGNAAQDQKHAERTADMVRAAVREEVASFFLDESRPDGMIGTDA